MTAHKFPLSQKYRDFIRSTQGVTAEFLEGTTASGKTTVGAGVKFMYMVSASPKRLHIIAAKTTGIAEKNIIQQENGILDLHRNAVYCGNGDRNNKLPHIKFEGKLIYVLGYDNKDKWENVLGSQFGCVYIDEINTADIDFVREISTRNDYLLATLNPDDPSLPVYQEFVNRSRPCARYAAQEQAWRKRLNSLVKENSDVLRMDYRRLKVYDAPAPPAGKTAAVPPTPKPKTAKAKVHTEGGSAGYAVEVAPPVPKDNVGYSLEKIRGKSLTSGADSGIIKDGRVVAAVESGKISLNLNPEKQKPHIYGSPAYDEKEHKSYFTVSIEELQEIVSRYHGTGNVLVKKNGQIKEIIKVEKDIGVCIDEKTGEPICSTNEAVIHYSKKRTHIVPKRKDDAE